MQEDQSDRLRNPGGRESFEAQTSEPSLYEELSAFVELGMKRDALALARRVLKKVKPATDEFRIAMSAVLVFAEASDWADLLESAYVRLSKLGQESARFDLMEFRCRCENYEGVIELTPPPFSAECDYPGMPFAMESFLALDRMDLAAELAKHLPAAIELAGFPLKAMLMQWQAEYLARTHQWTEALAVLEKLQQAAPLDHWATSGMVEIYVIRALQSLERWFELNQQFEQGFNPELELSLPGGEKKLRKDSRKEFLRVRKILEKIVPRERQMEIELDSKSGL